MEYSFLSHTVRHQGDLIVSSVLDATFSNLADVTNVQLPGSLLKSSRIFFAKPLLRTLFNYEIARSVNEFDYVVENSPINALYRMYLLCRQRDSEAG